MKVGCNLKYFIVRNFDLKQERDVTSLKLIFSRPSNNIYFMRLKFTTTSNKYEFDFINMNSKHTLSFTDSRLLSPRPFNIQIY